MAVPGGSHGPGDAGEELPAETRQRFTISRIPRNMHPDRNAERRQARAVALARSWDSREGTLYVDGAGPVLGVAAIAVASAQGQIRRVASVRAQTVEQVEEAAIALAVVCNPRATIISDSQRACQNFARGVVGQPALRLLRKTAVEGVHLIWTPGHMGQVGNEAANAAARGALYRDSVLPQRDLDNALTHSEALKALRTHRAEYPGPAKGLSKEEEFTWRRLQTDTFVTPIQLHLWYPERYATADCPFCAAIAVISEDASPTQNKTITSSELDIDPSLPAPQRQLSDLLAEFSECFSTSSKVEELTRQLTHEREQRVGLEKQAEELGEVWKAGLEERKRECDSRVERLEGRSTLLSRAGVTGGRESSLLAGGLDDSGELSDTQLNGAFEQQASGS
ncbi:uncharacterized protein ISCGN_026771 [Ixodes scapularis]